MNFLRSFFSCLAVSGASSGCICGAGTGILTFWSAFNTSAIVGLYATSVCSLTP
ncbi:MAG: hypothetical protein ACLTSJ_02525 [Alistipes communis]